MRAPTAVIYLGASLVCLRELEGGGECKDPMLVCLRDSIWEIYF